MGARRASISTSFTVRPDGSGLTRVTEFGPGEERASQPTWTSDGRIIFTHSTGAADEKGNIAFINPDSYVKTLIWLLARLARGSLPRTR